MNKKITQSSFKVKRTIDTICQMINEYDILASSAEEAIAKASEGDAQSKWQNYSEGMTISYNGNEQTHGRILKKEFSYEIIEE